MTNTTQAITMPPEFECDQLLADAARAIAIDLQNSIANLGYPVGMGMAPHPDTCLAAATRIVERFRGATRAALLAEHLAARVAMLENGVAPTSSSTACLQYLMSRLPLPGVIVDTATITVADQTHAAVRRAFADTRWAGGGWTRALLQLPGATRGKRRFGGHDAHNAVTIPHTIDPATPPDAA